MRWLAALALLLPGCVEYGPISSTEDRLDLRREGARLWVDAVEGRLDWGALYLRAAACLDPSFEAVLHMGSSWGVVNAGADSTGKAVTRAPPLREGPCAQAKPVRIESQSQRVRYGDFLELCTTPQSRESTMRDVVLVVADAFESERARVRFDGFVPSCRR